MRLIAALLVLGSYGFIVAACGQAELEGYFPPPDQDLEVIHSEAQSFVVDTVLKGLDMPYSMAFLPDKRVLITERAGNLLFVEKGRVVKEQSIGKEATKELRDIELHPEYESNGWVYISYYIYPTDDDGGYTALMRRRLDGNEFIDEEDLYKAGPFEQGGDWFGSRISFDRNGYLFFTVGQRGENENAQNLSHYSGKIVRLHDDGRIPSDNPFIDSVGAIPEMYTYGHRQTQGLVRHPETGAIWSHEHGEKGGDEVNIIKAGSNYGWPEVTYSLNYDDTIISEDSLRDDVEPPVHHWTPSIGPSGMDFVYGERYPGWNGNLFSGALAQRLVMRSVVKNNSVIHEEKLLEGIGRVRSIRFAPDGFLYAMTEDTGLLVRLLPVD